MGEREYRISKVHNEVQLNMELDTGVTGTKSWVFKILSLYGYLEIIVLRRRWSAKGASSFLNTLQVVANLNGKHSPPVNMEYLK